MQNMTQAELQVGIKEIQNGVLIHSDGYDKETGSLSIINMKNLQHLNCEGKETDNSLRLKTEGGCFLTTPELDNPEAEHHVKNTESGGRDLTNETDVEEVLDTHKQGTRGSKPNEENRGNELNCSNRDEHEFPVSGAQNVTSKFFETDYNMYTDKSVMECELPQLIGFCKDVDCQHIKDICVDKGEPLGEKKLIDKHTDNFAVRHVSKPSSEYGTNETLGDLHYEVDIPDGSRRRPRQVDLSNLAVDVSEAKEERKVVTPVLSKSEYPPAGKVIENGPNSEAFMIAIEKNVGIKIEKYVLVEEPLVITKLPPSKFGTSGRESFMDSSNSLGDEIDQKSNQRMEVTPESPDAELESEESNQNDAGHISLDLCHEPAAADSRGVSDEVREKPWIEEIMQNHNYRNFTDDPLAAHVVQRANMDEAEEEYVINNEFRSSNNPFLVSEIHSSGKDESTVDTHHETLLKNTEGHWTNPFGVVVQSVIVELNTSEILPTIVTHKENFNPFAFSKSGTLSLGKNTEASNQVSAESPKRTSNNPFDCEVENVNMDKNRETIDQQPANNPFEASEVHSSGNAKGIRHSDQQHELDHRLNSYNPFTVSDDEDASTVDKITGDTGTETVLEQHSLELRDPHNHEGAIKDVSFTDEGEAGIGHTSFSAVSGRITYSGPIAISGSTSLRSDSSATSTRSFAFPVLQTEWNSSPVRMEKADRRQYRKQRGGWKHGILCCCKF